MWFGLMLLTMLAGAIHYSNSLAFILTFLLSGLLGISMWQTQRNLLGLKIEIGTASDLYAGSEQSLPLTISSTFPDTGHSIVFQWRDASITITGTKGAQDAQTHVKVIPAKRGWFDPGRFRIYSRFPLGLFQAWSWLEFDRRLLVYPKPLTLPLPERTSGELGSDSIGHQSGTEDFAGLRDYRPGDASTRISWKSLAAKQLPQTKIFNAGSTDELWLDWDDILDSETELKLSYLCAQVIEADRLQLEYGLKLPRWKISPNHGGNHKHECLKALALYE
jgi:uncharacterized protein (DUF58 family)